MRMTVETLVVVGMTLVGATGAFAWTIVTHAPLPVRAEPAAVEMGSVPVGTVARGTFHLVNRTDRPIRIASTRTSCGCTAVNPPGNLAPGASAEIPVTMATAGRSGAVEQTITVLLQGQPDRPLLIPVRATVSAPMVKSTVDDGTCKGP